MTTNGTATATDLKLIQRDFLIRKKSFITPEELLKEIQLGSVNSKHPEEESILEPENILRLCASELSVMSIIWLTD